MTRITILFFCLCLFATSFAQQKTEITEAVVTPGEELNQQIKKIGDAIQRFQNFKVSGYIQAQYQYGQKDAELKVGGINENMEESFNRIGIRRGRIKFAYEEKLFSGVFQLDATEKEITIKDVYFSLKTPWVQSISLKAGIFDRPFGNEISYPSSLRESTEQSFIFQTLFPKLSDLGAMLTLQAPKSSSWNFLKLETGLFAGNGIKQETDNRKDFIGHLSANKNVGKDIKVGGGISYYNGGVYKGSDSVYIPQGNGFILEDSSALKNRFSKREYVGIDAQFSITSVLGTSQLRAEYLLGKQPAAKADSKSPNSSTLPKINTYVRNFSGGYIIFVQDLGKLPLSAVLQYDWFDPNTKVEADEIGLKNTTVGDVAQNTLGFGLLWQAHKSVRLQAYYEINKNETTENLTEYQKDIENDVFTLRLQYKF